MVLISCMGSVTFPLLAPWQRKLDAFKAFPAGMWEKKITIEIWAVAQHQGYAFILGISYSHLFPFVGFKTLNCIACAWHFSASQYCFFHSANTVFFIQDRLCFLFWIYYPIPDKRLDRQERKKTNCRRNEQPEESRLFHSMRIMWHTRKSFRKMVSFGGTHVWWLWRKFK